MKNLFFKAAKRSAIFGWWSLIATIVLMYFCYYGVFPNNNT